MKQQEFQADGDVDDIRVGGEASNWAAAVAHGRHIGLGGEATRPGQPG
jgi:hypothetical protein